ncbi:MAG: hypothetical protein KGL46_03010 [Hyphomicrobiales bacterium]|nr:hypothetical protein [Hyphomicrobiales bacterium]
MRRFLAKFSWTALAAIFLIEAWLWDFVGGAIARLVAALPIEALRKILRAIVARTPPLVALGFFAVPVLVVLPFKLVGVALIASGRLVLGGAVFITAKTLGLGVTAFIFDVCHDRLMEMDWFVRLYQRVLSWRDWAHEQVAPYRAALRQRVALLRARVAALLPAGSPRAARIAAMRARAYEKR